jgi:endonuclease/exonuclease/phosphatase (EEP) superfamily protein YafD
MAKLPLRSKIILVGINIFFLSLLISTLISIYPLELYVSLLPYLLMISAFLLILELMSIKVYELGKKVGIVIIFFSLLCLIYPTYIFANQVLIAPNINIASKNTLKITFQNKYYLNPNIEGLNKQAKELDPDIIGFAEVNDPSEYKKYLDKYPYEFHTKLETLMGVVLFSKYELKDSEALNASKDGDINHSPYIKTKVIMPDKSEVNLLMVHLIAPTGSGFTKLKGDALDIISTESNKLEGNTIVIGDFNTTPYSPQISGLRNSSKFYSASKGKGLLDTWEGPSFLKFQIDHAFVSNNMKVDNFEVKDTIGSDHHLIYLKTSF